MACLSPRFDVDVRVWLWSGLDCFGLVWYFSGRAREIENARAGCWVSANDRCRWLPSLTKKSDGSTAPAPLPPPAVPPSLGLLRARARRSSSGARASLLIMLLLQLRHLRHQGCPADRAAGSPLGTGFLPEGPGRGARVSRAAPVLLLRSIPDGVVMV